MSCIFRGLSSNFRLLNPGLVRNLTFVDNILGWHVAENAAEFL